MNPEICLVIIFNHRYEKNLPLLRKLYSGRFSNVVFVMPFYTGDSPDVVSVYESSYQFQGYIAQAYPKIASERFSHYVFAGDDLILNPEIDERNLLGLLGVGEGDAYIESLTALNRINFWSYERFFDAHSAFAQLGANYRGEIPPYEEAKKSAEAHGLRDYSVTSSVRHARIPIRRVRGNLYQASCKLFKPIRIDYPLVTGYSDFFVLPKERFDSIAHLFGVFAAMRLFVEIAIPTAMMLTYDARHLKTQADAKILTPKLWHVTDAAKNFGTACQFQLSNIEKCFPKDYAYLHPVKLSGWKE